MRSGGTRACRAAGRRCRRVVRPGRWSTSAARRDRADRGLLDLRAERCRAGRTARQRHLHRLEPWTTVADGGFVLTQQRRDRDGRHPYGDVDASPAVPSSPTDAVTGTASVLLSVDGTPAGRRSRSTSRPRPAQPVDGPRRRGDGHPGRRRRRPHGPPRRRLLRRARRGPPGRLQRPEPGASPGGPNPATDPMPTDVTTDFTAVGVLLGHDHLGRRPGGLDTPPDPATSSTVDARRSGLVGAGDPRSCARAPGTCLAVGVGH